jgi:hypothetical protein
MAKRRQTRYRDSETGRFVSKSTWTRSHTQGGRRYKRERYLPLTKSEREAIEEMVKEAIEEEISREPIRTLDELEDYIDENDEELEEIEFEGAFDS